MKTGASHTTKNPLIFISAFVECYFEMLSCHSPSRKLLHIRTTNVILNSLSLCASILTFGSDIPLVMLNNIAHTNEKVSTLQRYHACQATA